MTTTQHAKHAAPRRTSGRRSVLRATVVAAGAALLAPALGVGASNAVTLEPEKVTMALPDGAATYMALKFDLDGDGAYEQVHDRHIPGKKDQTITLGVSGTFTDPPSLVISGSCRTVTARFADNAFAVVADHAYQPTKQLGDGTTVDDGERRLDRYGKGVLADTPNPGIEYTFCR